MSRINKLGLALFIVGIDFYVSYSDKFVTALVSTIILIVGFLMFYQDEK